MIEIRKFHQLPYDDPALVAERMAKTADILGDVARTLADSSTSDFSEDQGDISAISRPQLARSRATN